jgi:hypothetical protein
MDGEPWGTPIWNLVMTNYILTIYMHCNTLYADIYSKRGMLSPLVDKVKPKRLVNRV